MRSATAPPVAPGSRILVRDCEWLVRRVDRTSTGGQAYEAVGISELFLDPERLVVETRGRQRGDNQKYVSSNHNAEFLNLPVAVLVDGEPV